MLQFSDLIRILRSFSIYLFVLIYSFIMILTFSLDCKYHKSLASCPKCENNLHTQAVKRVDLVKYDPK